MQDSTVERALIVYLRVAIGWTFLYAGIHHLLDPSWSVAGFLSHTKTFHDVYAVFATPAVAPVITFLVNWGHLLIGLSLISGLMVRVSGVFAILLMLMYWTAHMDFPYVENKNSFIIDYHPIYAGVIAYLIAKRAGHIWGLDAWAEKLQFFKRHPTLRPLFA